MKKNIVACILAVCLLSGCADAPETEDTGSETEDTGSETEVSVSTSTSAPVETSTASTVPVSAAQEAYDDLISRLVSARQGEMDEDQVVDLCIDISSDTILAPEQAEIYYTQIDLDGDGTDELFIYQYMMLFDGSEVPVIYDGYTYSNDELVHFIAGGARNSYFLAADGSVYNMGSYGPVYLEFSRYTYSDGILTLTDSYFSDDTTGTLAWYYSDVGAWADERTEASEDDAYGFFCCEHMAFPFETAV